MSSEQIVTRREPVPGTLSLAAVAASRQMVIIRNSSTVTVSTMTSNSTCSNLATRWRRIKNQNAGIFIVTGSTVLTALVCILRNQYNQKRRTHAPACTDRQHLCRRRCQLNSCQILLVNGDNLPHDNNTQLVLMPVKQLTTSSYELLSFIAWAHSEAKVLLR